MTHQLTRDEARRIVVRAQLLDADRPGDVVEVAEQLGYVKIDPTATIAPCEHTVLWSRIGWSYEAGQLTKAVEIDRLLFEFDGAFRPVSLLPMMLPAMRRWPRRESTRQWLDANSRFRKDVLARLKADGPLLAADIPDTAQVSRAPDGWTGSNQVPTMLDFLMRQGQVAIVGREGRHKRWDLAERVYPTDLPEYDDEEATHDARASGRSRQPASRRRETAGGTPSARRASRRPSRAASGSSGSTPKPSRLSKTMTAAASRSSTRTTGCCSTGRAWRRSSSSRTCSSSSSPSRSASTASSRIRS